MRDPRNDPATPSLLQEQIARLKNETLLMRCSSVETLRSNIEHHTFQMLFLHNQKDDLYGFTNEVKALKEALEGEYGRRVLRGYQGHYQRLLATLQPTHDQEPVSFRLIALHAGVHEDVAEGSAAEGGPDGSDVEHTIQAATALFQDHLHALLTRLPEGEATPQEKGASHDIPVKE